MRSSPTSHGSPSDSEPIPESADVALAAPPVAADPAASPAPSAGTAPPPPAVGVGSVAASAGVPRSSETGASASPR